MQEVPFLQELELDDTTQHSVLDMNKEMGVLGIVRQQQPREAPDDGQDGDMSADGAGAGGHNHRRDGGLHT